jgi:hypothetical protein
VKMPRGLRGRGTDIQDNQCSNGKSTNRPHT